MLRRRGLVVRLVVVLLLAAALLAPPTGRGAAPAVLVLLAPLFALVAAMPVPGVDANPRYSYLAAGPRPSRAPPSA